MPLLLMANNAQESAINAVLTQELDDDLQPETCLSQPETVKVGTILAAANYLRSDLKQQPTVHVTGSSDIDEAKAGDTLPDSLYMFLRWLLEGTDGKESITLQKSVCECTETDRKILSMGQDLVWILSKGRKYTPKHIGLAMAIKHLTGSKDILSIIHRYGHCASYSTIERFETAIAIEYLARQSDDKVLIPANIKAGTFVQAAADNLDFQEETLDGKMTTHATTMVLYQRQANEKHNTPNQVGEKLKRVRSKALKSVSEFCQEIFPFHSTSRKPSPCDLLSKIKLDWFPVHR